MYLLQAGVKYSYGMELRDRGVHRFTLPVDQIRATVEETWEGIRKMSELIAQEYIKGNTYRKL